MRYIALLRGINVGGNTMVKMSELASMFEALGFDGVKTYINSGNIAFDAPKTAEAKLVAKIEKAIEDTFEKNIPVMLREQKQIDIILASNPFEGEFESHKEMHVLFLSEEMSAVKEKQLLEAALEGERYKCIGRELYCYLPKGVIESLLGKSFIEKKLRLAVTGRNWRTVQKLAEL
ncbi:MAG TPA: DUF1697 domain-containing protein [Pyrinomonadaceae bacterium]|nr:DUF1697 domain-containing protein [Pyrinomonadaceae bacterium]